MEGSHGQLGTRFADGLGSDGADGFAHFHLLGGGQVAAVAGTADPKVGFAGQYGTDLHFFPQVSDHIGHVFGDVVVDMVDDLAVFVSNVFGQGTAHQTVTERFQHRALVFAGGDGFHIDTIHFVVPDFQFLHSPVFQDLFDHVSGELVAGFGQDFILFVDNVFFHLFVQEVMGHVFPEGSLDFVFRHVDGQSFRFFAAFLVSRIQADFQDMGGHETIVHFFRHHRIGFGQDGIPFRIHHAGSQGTANGIVLQFMLAGTQDGFAEPCPFPDQIHAGHVAVVFPDDNVLGHVYQTAGQVTGVSGTQCGIGQTFPGTVGRNEVFQNGQAFTEVGFDGSVDDPAGRVSHQTTHTGQLTDLLHVTTGT